MIEKTTRHQIERFRQEPKRRALTVAQIIDITPHMRRIIFTSPALADFSSRSADDHIKVFVPDPQAGDGLCMRDYTPRTFDPERRLLTIDFALHESGPATTWAKGARVGDRLEIGGPRGSQVVPDDFDHYLLVGDETALASIGRRVESLRAGVPVTTVVVVADEAEVQHFETRAQHRPIWVFRNGRAEDDGTLLCAALAHWQAPQGEGYGWVAAEAQAARAVKAYLLDERGWPKIWLKSSGYWVRGAAGATDKMEA